MSACPIFFRLIGLLTQGTDLKIQGGRPGFARRLLALSCCLAGLASADTLGDFTYTDNGTTITITDYPTTATGAVIIPSEIVGKPVTTIGLEAFADCKEITSVTIPTGVTSIGTRAFMNCSGLTSAPIPAGLTSLEVQAFAYCVGLTSMTLPSGVTTVANSLFEGCLGLTSVTLHEGITSIGSNAFNTCAALTNLTLPSNVTSIGASAFIFSGLKSAVVPSGVTILQSNTFRGCSGLTNVSLSPGLLTISGSCFADCIALPGIAIPSTVTAIGTFAFTKCTALTSLAIPNGVLSLSNNLFEGCSLLSSVTIPPSVTSIGNNAFRLCSALATIAIPSSVLTIGTDVFGSCAALTSISVDAANTSFSSVGGVLFNKLQTTLIVYPRGLPGAYAVPASVTSIGNNAFRFAGGLTRVDIPSSVTTIGLEAFAGCGGLTAISVDAANAAFSSLDGVLFNPQKTTLIAYPPGLGGSYAIPYGVSTLTASAFRYCAGLTTVTVPSSMTTIGNSAFSTCGLLTGATFIGKAPTTFGTNVFNAAAATFKVYYYPGAAGFISPIWNTYASAELGAVDPVVFWLQTYGLPLDSDFSSDANGDGVSLVMAYALNLNPTQNLSGIIPQPSLLADQMSLSFYAGAAGVTYVVETCTDLGNWTTEGVSLSAPDANQIRTATVSRADKSRFMRLKVSQ